MGDTGPHSTSLEAENSGMFQARDHTIISGFPALSPSPYSSTTRLTNVICSFKGKLIAATTLFVFIIVLWKTFATSTSRSDYSPTWSGIPHAQLRQYPMQSSYQKYTADSTSYRVAIISDMDTASQIESSLVYRAEVKEGRLSRLNGKYRIDWDHTTLIKGEYNEKGRGMELSELVYYNNMLLSCDDRTGIVYEIMIEKQLAIPRWILPSGDAQSSAKGLKCEWMTVKGDKLYAGSIGKEYIRNGKIVSFENTWIKTIDPNGTIKHIDWRTIYDHLREVTGTSYPGYMVHEAVGWSESLHKWVFLPRRVSKEAYDEKLDERKGSNLALIVDEDFSNIKQMHLGDVKPSHGFSSFKFVPFREHEIIALKSVEDGNTIKTFMTAFNLVTGEVLMDETEVSSNTKFEGFEFL